MNKLWRTALLTASRNLRQSVLHGRIWGFGSSSSPSIPSPSDFPHEDPDEDDPDDTPNNRRLRSRASSTAGSTIYSSASSSSSVESLYSPEKGSGRVKGMVQSFERDSESRRARSGSVSSVESNEFESASERNVTTRRPLPTPPRFATEESEMTVEQLLAAGGGEVHTGVEYANRSSRKGKQRQLGVYAWETELGLGETVKHVGGDRPSVEDVFGGGQREVPSEVHEAQAEIVLSIEREVEDTRALIARFRERLEEVERKVGEMEDRDLEREQQWRLRREAKRRLKAEEEDERRRLVKRAREQSSHAGLLGILLSSKPGSALMDAMGYAASLSLALIPTTSASVTPPASSSLQDTDIAEKQPTTNPDADTTTRPRQDPTDLLSVRALPSYVLLVGLGVCVVVLRVMLRRSLTLGRRR